VDIFEAISKRRSIRQYDPTKPVGDEVVQKVLDAAIAAPNAGNGQNWRFVVVRDKELRHKLAFEAGHQKFIEEAPVAIVVCSDLEGAAETYGDRGSNTYALQETAAAVENMLLVITALGFGSCWVGAFNESVASVILGLPQNVRPLAIIPIGVPLEPVTRIPPRKKLEDVVTFT